MESLWVKFTLCLFWLCSIEVALSFKWLWSSTSPQDALGASGLLIFVRPAQNTLSVSMLSYSEKLNLVSYLSHDAEGSCCLKKSFISMTLLPEQRSSLGILKTTYFCDKNKFPGPNCKYVKIWI